MFCSKIEKFSRPAALAVGSRSPKQRGVRRSRLVRGERRGLFSAEGREEAGRRTRSSNFLGKLPPGVQRLGERVAPEFVIGKSSLGVSLRL